MRNCTHVNMIDFFYIGFLEHSKDNLKIYNFKGSNRLGFNRLAPESKMSSFLLKFGFKIKFFAD